MPIKKDLANLPAATRTGGDMPSETPVVVTRLAKAWFQRYTDEGNIDRAMAIEGTSYRASWANIRCDRELQYVMQGIEGNPRSIADFWRMGLGSMIHAYMEPFLASIHPNAQAEVTVDLRPLGINGSAHADIVVYGGSAPDQPDVLDVVEVKSINGFGFKKAATAFKGPAEGPRWGAVVQGALSAAALEAQRLIIAYFSLENLSPGLATSYTDGDAIDRFAAEWHFSRDEFLPIAHAEAERIRRVTALTEDGILAPRQMHDPSLPAGATITDPARKAWQVRIGGEVRQAGTYWACDYCDFRDRCIADGEGGSDDTSVVF